MSYIGNSPATSTEVADNSVTLAKMAHGTDGELITYDATGAPANVAVGTSGQVLTSGGAGVAPTFQTAAGGGKVLQVVSVRSTSSTAVSGTYPGNIPHADTGLSLAITPTESDSDILILVVQSATYDTGSEAFDISVHRDSTALNNYSGNGVGFGPIVNSLNVGTVQRGQQSLQYFDTGRSAGTSAITYKTRGGPYRTGTVTFQGEGFQSTMILMEISV